MARIRAESRPNEFIEHLVFTWDFRPVGERTCRLDLTLDFELRQPEHVLIWTMTNEKIISECARDGHYALRAPRHALSLTLSLTL